MNSDIARKHLVLEPASTPRIFIRDQAAFGQEFANARIAAIDAQLKCKETGSNYSGKSVQNRRAVSLRRSAKVFDPLGKKLCIYGIRLASGFVQEDSDKMLSALADAWRPTFAKDSHLDERARKLA